MLKELDHSLLLLHRRLCSRNVAQHLCLDQGYVAKLFAGIVESMFFPKQMVYFKV